MKFLCEDGTTKNICAFFPYHGITLCAVETGERSIAVYEPAYGIRLDAGNYDEALALRNGCEGLKKSLDDLSERSRVISQENNFFPVIASCVIKQGVEVVNRFFNSLFVEKVEEARKNVNKRCVEIYDFDIDEVFAGSFRTMPAFAFDPYKKKRA